MALSFATDIAPIFSPFRAAMRWRFDLLDYNNVKANAEIIYGRISIVESPLNNVPMPPPPFSPLTPEQIGTFRKWMDQGCPP